ncbi:enoyl-CoA hydratase/isomerase family protein [Sphingomonas colocasiae]|uniref:Enoyl-CoA hydratase/isomerase family protein n=1 Tax=Sphingomonas colocasiae TaxID=1848973 RepID=A0ABS7PQR0_9SPHN|nr:enoyl-CoA hydratase-related protein [Sphingomonas colocasiae]MBY8823581.1 enoyl-CoA hydratase/isomerase family protein [Sphingomonas colocasiae]
MTAPATIRVERTGAVGLITLDRPDRLNAYTPDMGDELVDGFRALATDGAVGAIVVTGAGRAFCAGADHDFLGGRLSRRGKPIGEEHFVAGFTEELFSLPKPTIAAVNGPAVGIGATMLLSFDFRLAGRGASFGFPFARLGLMPGMGSTHLLPAIVGAAQARQILLSGATLDAARAREIGLVGEVLDDDALHDAAITLAERIAALDGAAIAGCKRALNQAGLTALRAAVAQERQETATLNASRRAAAEGQ